MRAERIRWRMRRGLKELDVLLERYFAVRYVQAPESERRALARLLDHEDPVIWDWVMGRETAPPELDDVVRKLRGDA